MDESQTTAGLRPESAGADDEGLEDEEEQAEGGEEKAKEEGEEEEKDEDDDDGRPKGRPPPYYAFTGEEYNEKGNYMNIEGTRIYAVGEKTQVGLLFIGDLFGWAEGRLKEIADYVAVATRSRVVLPMLLDDPCFVEGTKSGTEGDGLPPGFEEEKHKDEFKKWIMKYTWEIFKPKILTAIVHLRSGGCKRIGGVGFGFGAWLCARMSAITGEWRANILLYPEIERFELMNGGDADALARKIKGEVLFMTSGEDSKTYFPKGELFAQVAANNPATETMPFLDMKKGWALRGDFRTPGVRPSTEKAVSMISRYIRKFLWPPPPGFNASTLRFAARSGDSDTVEALVKSGVPITGKDAVDSIGLTPMHYAATAGFAMPIKILIENEADVNERGGAGLETPLHLAALMGHTKACKALIDAKCELEPMDRSGQAPIHYAATKGMHPICELLVFSKGNIDVRDTAGQSALHLAAYYGKAKVVVALLNMNMEVDPLDLRFKTPQKRALEQGFMVIADLFKNVREQRQPKDDTEGGSAVGGYP